MRLQFRIQKKSYKGVVRYQPQIFRRFFFGESKWYDLHTDKIFKSYDGSPKTTLVDNMEGAKEWINWFVEQLRVVEETELIEVIERIKIKI